MITRRCDRITPILYNLHWLPVQDRIVFKVLLITYKALYGMAPPYIADLINKYIPKCNLRSSTSNQLEVQHYNLNFYGHRTFSCAAPILWNLLPDDLRHCDSLLSFKRQLKTYLFHKTFIDT